ncbi:hypothetical protein PXK05_11525 [Phaeobacter gallaeciensis]|nr:hypothetical protein [Phaeobacter gallaeciensis]MDE4229069.1 hypothetical protein [Phaeobacter gallaeciensis]MDE4266570.1 hypothetical protein [Phaeobacter gallaeciensis]
MEQSQQSPVAAIHLDAFETGIDPALIPLKNLQNRALMIEKQSAYTVRLIVSTRDGKNGVQVLG